MSASSLIDRLVGQVDCCPWGTVAGRRAVQHAVSPAHQAAHQPAHQNVRPLYSAEERRRRDASGWTTVQGVLAPVQFLVFLVSLTLVLRTLVTGEGLAEATASVVLKTFALYAIMVTGAIWEKEVFGRYLFAPVFFWEDAFSILVLALHTGYLAAIALGLGSPRAQLFLALAAYAAYLINAGQFLMKLRAARLQAAPLGVAR